MAKKRIGIDALFASTLVPVATPLEVGVRRLPLDELVPNPHQPRRRFDDVALVHLVDSIKQSGVLQPIIVRERTIGRQGRARYEIVVGERRWRAARMAGLSEIPAIVRTLSDEEALQVALIENLQREDLNPLEETEGYLALLKIKLSDEPEFAIFARATDRDPYADVLRLLFAMNNQRADERGGRSSESRGRGGPNNNVVIKLAPIVEAVFAAIGRTNWLSFIQHRLPLRRLPADLLEALRQGRIEYTKARLLGRITGEALGCEERQATGLRIRLLQRAVEESLSLGALRRIVEVEVAAWRTGGPSSSQTNASRAFPLQDLVDQTVAKLRRLRPEQLSGKYQQKLQQKLNELCTIIERRPK